MIEYILFFYVYNHISCHTSVIYNIYYILQYILKYDQSQKKFEMLAVSHYSASSKHAPAVLPCLVQGKHTIFRTN